MEKEIGFVVNCSVAGCERPIGVPARNIGCVIFSEGRASVLADVAKEADCPRPECGSTLGFSITTRPDSIEWLEAHVAPERTRTL